MPGFDPKVVRYCIYQREIAPETKREHFQGYIEFYDQMRIGQVKAVLGECHLEPRQGSRTAAREYCMKDESAIEGTLVEYGEWREEANRKHKLSDLLKTNMSLDDIINDTPHFFVMYHRGLQKLFSLRAEKKARIFRTVVVVVLVGATGVGKTRRATEDGEDYFFMPCSDKMWFDGYRGQKTLIIDDFYGNIKYSFLLRILDGYSLQLPVKGGFIRAQWTKVFITSNAEVCDWYKAGLTPALKRRISTIIHM